MRWESWGPWTLINSKFPTKLKYDQNFRNPQKSVWGSQWIFFIPLSALCRKSFHDVVLFLLCKRVLYLWIAPLALTRWRYEERSLRICYARERNHRPLRWISKDYCFDPTWISEDPLHLFNGFVLQNMFSGLVVREIEPKFVTRDSVKQLRGDKNKMGRRSHLFELRRHHLFNRTEEDF